MCLLQVVQSDSEEADGFEGVGQRAELRRHCCEDPGDAANRKTLYLQSLFSETFVV